MDERIELTCAVFRLANIPEFNQGLIDEYNQDIDSCFRDFKDGQLTEYIKTMRRENGLGYSAVVGSAMYLQIDDGTVKVNEDMDLSSLPGLGSQWKDINTFREYVNLLNDFYRKSGFHSFYESHLPLYGHAETGMTDVLQYLNPDWFVDFFNNDPPALGVYVAPGLGPNNYFIYGGSDIGYSIVIGARPAYQFELLEMIVHETCHYYSNPLFYQYWPHMEKAACVMYPYASGMVANNGYGSAQETMLEWQNCLFCLMYYRDNIDFFLSKMPDIADIADIDFRDLFVSPILQTITEKGFIWMPRSVDFMENFYNNRDIYHNIEDFMPQLVGFLDNAAENYGQIIFEYEHRRPYVTDIFPVNGSNLLDVLVNEIRITFSEPMAEGIYSLGRNFEDTTFSCLPYKDAYFADERTFVIEFDRSKLEENKEYRLQFNGSFFCDSEYNKMGSDYVITYTTGCDSTGTAGR